MTLDTARTAIDDAVRIALAFAGDEHRLLIGGEWVTAAGGGVLEVENPATGRVVGSVPAGSAVDADRAVRAARDCFEARSWRGVPPSERAAALWRLSDLIVRDRQALMRLEVLDNGMPLAFAERIVGGAVESLRYYAGMCTKLGGRTADMGSALEFHSYSVRQPVGVAALIVPWNGPLATACGKLAPSLAAGCSVVLKPAEQTPLSALWLAGLVREAGIPDGAVNVVTGTGESAGQALVEHPDVDAVSFTGSTAVGQRIVETAARDLKRISLELGGKSPVFVFDDADLATAVPAAAMGIFGNSGQICYAGSRLYAQSGIRQELVAGLRDFARGLCLGDGLDAATQLGPLVSREQQERVLAYVESGVDAGAELVTGGAALGDTGYFVTPTIFDGVDPSMGIVREEIFGPVLTVAGFDGLDDVERIANATTYGLGAGVYTRDLSTAHRAAAVIDAGNVWVNNYGRTNEALPFGGFKMSGWGREKGEDGVDAFLEKKSVYIKL